MQKKGMVCFIYYKPFHPKIYCLTVNYSYNKFYLNGELAMPEISRFYGLIIKMFFKPKEHEPPHIHALYGEYIGIFEISSLQMIEGDLPNKARQLVLEWLEIHQQELLSMWQTQLLKKLPPLE